MLADDGDKRIRIELFGGPRVRTADGPLIVFQAKVGALLALLALRRGRRCSRNELAAAIWDDEKPNVTRARLRVALAHLRQQLPYSDECIGSDHNSIWLTETAFAVVDSEEFDQVLADLSAAPGAVQHSEGLEQLEALYAGPLCPRIHVRVVERHRAHYAERMERARAALASGTACADNAAIGQASCDHNVVESGADERADPEPGPATPTKSAIRRPRQRISIWAFISGAVAVALVWISFAFLQQVTSASHRVRSPAEKVATIHLLHSEIASATTAQFAEQARTALARNCIDLAEEASLHWRRPGEGEWIARLRDVNVETDESLLWLCSHDPPRALQLTGALNRFWDVLGRVAEARRWLDLCLGRSANAPHRIRARGLALYAYVALHSTAMETPEARKSNWEALSAIRAAQQLYAQAGDRQGQANAMRTEGHVLHALGLDDEAATRFQQALAIFTQESDKAGQSCVWWGVGLLRFKNEGSAGCQVRQTESMLKSVQLFRETGGDWHFPEAFSDLSVHIDSFGRMPPLPEQPNVVQLICHYMDECRARMDRPEVRESATELTSLRRNLAGAAILVKQYPAGVEQLGHLIGPLGDIRGELAVLLAGAYLNHLSVCASPPFTASETRSMVKVYARQSGISDARVSELMSEGGRLPLREAIGIAVKRNRTADLIAASELTPKLETLTFLTFRP
jgi:tetratricopeptide (TPR) repeat protein